MTGRAQVEQRKGAEAVAATSATGGETGAGRQREIKEGEVMEEAGEAVEAEAAAEAGAGGSTTGEETSQTQSNSVKEPDPSGFRIRPRPVQGDLIVNEIRLKSLSELF